MCTGSNKPTTELLNDIFKEISSDCDWYSLGLRLLQEVWAHKLNTIEKSNPDDEEKFYDEMLEFCLDITWSKMIGVLKKVDAPVEDALKEIDVPVEMIQRDDSIKGF